MTKWLNDVDSISVLNYLAEFFDYDHFNGRLLWTSDISQIDRLPPQMKRQIVAGHSAGTTCREGYDYEIKIAGRLRNALPLIWEHQTGVVRRTVMTIRPDEDRFSIDNLCLLPYGKMRAPKTRAKNKRVVSWSYERKQFTVVDVDGDYNKSIVSYHDDMQDAIDASKITKEVSFL